MTDLLNLPYWNVLKVQETDLNYVIDATYGVGKGELVQNFSKRLLMHWVFPKQKYFRWPE